MPFIILRDGGAGGEHWRERGDDGDRRRDRSSIHDLACAAQCRADREPLQNLTSSTSRCRKRHRTSKHARIACDHEAGWRAGHRHASVASVGRLVSRLVATDAWVRRVQTHVEKCQRRDGGVVRELRNRDRIENELKQIIIEYLCFATNHISLLQIVLPDDTGVDGGAAVKRCDRIDVPTVDRHNRHRATRPAPSGWPCPGEGSRVPYL